MKLSPSTLRPQVFMLHIHFVNSLPRDQSATVKALQLLNDTSYQQLLNERGLPTEGSSVSLLCSLPSLLQNWVGPNENSYRAAIPQAVPAALQMRHVFCLLLKPGEKQQRDAWASHSPVLHPALLPTASAAAMLSPTGF